MTVDARIARLSQQSEEPTNQPTSERTHVISSKEFRANTHREHQRAFSSHRAVAVLLESAVAKSRPMPSVVHIALDMLMTQAYKSHYGVRLMAERGHAEDSAVLMRRLLELAVQAAYIGMDSDNGVCIERAGRYLANLWREAPPELKIHLPAVATEQWTKIWADHGADLPKHGWGPPFKQMFAVIGQPRSYDEDYRFLSRIAHGSTEGAILYYSMPTVPLRSTAHISSLLEFASRYYLALAHVWEEYFHLIDQDEYLRSVKPFVEGMGLSANPPEQK